MWLLGAEAAPGRGGSGSPSRPWSAPGCGLGASSPFFGLDVDNDLMHGEAGRNFVVATVFPSREVQKNGIKVSWDLACILGQPSAGESLFISPLYISQDQRQTVDVEILRVIKCKDLYLCLVPPKVGSSNGIESKSDFYPVRNGMGMESPKKIPSSPLHRNESHDFAFNSGYSLCLNATTARAALADEKVNELLQTSATRWLSGRHLLKGNYVPLPMCGKLSLFMVMGAELDSSSLQPLYEKGNSMSNAEVSAKLGEAPVSFLVDKTTKVHLSDPVSSVKLGSDNPDLPSEFSVYTNIRNEDSNQAPSLGGLSKESETIKEYISFSMADRTDMPRYKGVLLYGPPEQEKPRLLLLVPMVPEPNFLQ